MNLPKCLSAATDPGERFPELLCLSTASVKAKAGNQRLSLANFYLVPPIPGFDL